LFEQPAGASYNFNFLLTRGRVVWAAAQTWSEPRLLGGFWSIKKRDTFPTRSTRRTGRAAVYPSRADSKYKLTIEAGISR